MSKTPILLIEKLKPFSDALKGMEVRLKVQNTEINRQRKIDTEGLLRALETEFIGGNAELQQSQAQQGRDLQHQATTGELKFNSPAFAQQVATLVSDMAQKEHLKGKVLEFGQYDPAQVIKRMNQLNSVTSKLATNSNILIRTFLNMGESLPDASDVKGFLAVNKALADTSIYMDDIRSIAADLKIPDSKVNKVVENELKKAIETFSDARDEDVSKVKRSSNQINRLLSEANRLKQQAGSITIGEQNRIPRELEHDRLLLKAREAATEALRLYTGDIKEENDAYDKAIADSKAAGALDVANRLQAEKDDPERAAGIDIQTQPLIDAVNNVYDVNKKFVTQQEESTEKITREIRKGSRDFLKSFQAFGAHILGPDNAITDFGKGLVQVVA